MRSNTLLLLVGLLAAGCYYEPPTFKPADAAFELTCPTRCGPDFSGRALLVGVDFAGARREYTVCCPDVPRFVTALKELRQAWCEGSDEGLPSAIGQLAIDPFESPLDGSRGVKLDEGQGYVAFKCHEWLDELVTRAEASSCCAQ